MDNMFVFIELILFFLFLPIVYNIMQALDLSRIFKKGYTNQIRVFLILLNVILAYFASHVITRILELSYTIAN